MPFPRLRGFVRGQDVRSVWISLSIYIYIDTCKYIHTRTHTDTRTQTDTYKSGVTLPGRGRQARHCAGREGEPEQFLMNKSVELSKAIYNKSDP